MAFVLLYLVVFVCCTLLTLVAGKRLLNIGVVFAFMWTFFGSISTFGYLGLTIPSAFTHICALISIASFIIPYAFVSGGRRSIATPTPDSTAHIHRRSLLIYLNLASYLFVAPLTFKSLAILRAYGPDYLRYIATTNSPLLINSTAIHIVNEWLVVPLYVATVAVSSVNIISKEKKDYPLILIALCSVGLWSATFIARALIVKYIMYVVFAFLFLRKGRLRLKPFHVAAAMILVVAVGLLWYITLQRNEYIKLSFAETIVMYYSGPFSLFDYYAQDRAASRLLLGDELLYGSATFGFLYNLIPTALTVLFRTEYFGSDHIITSITAISYRVSDMFTLNAVPTAMYVFMRDFGYPGLVIGFGFLGYITAKLEKRALAMDHIRPSALFIFMCYVVFKTVQNYDLLSPQTLFSFVFIWLFTRKPRLRTSGS